MSAAEKETRVPRVLLEALIKTSEYAEYVELRRDRYLEVVRQAEASMRGLPDSQKIVINALLHAWKQSGDSPGSLRQIAEGLGRHLGGIETDRESEEINRLLGLDDDALLAEFQQAGKELQLAMAEVFAWPPDYAVRDYEEEVD